MTEVIIRMDGGRVGSDGCDDGVRFGGSVRCGGGVRSVVVGSDDVDVRSGTSVRRDARVRCGAVGACVGGVRSGVRLGQRISRDDLSRCDLGQPSRLLRFASKQADRARSEALQGEGKVGQPAGVGEGRPGDGEAANVRRLVAIGHAKLEETSLTKLLHQFAAGRVDVMRMSV